MNNPFSRLKHYIPDGNDPQENHATECLAACLVFSPRLRAAFISFLFSHQPDFQMGDVHQVEVTTQYTIPGDGYIDLLLEQPGKFLLAVEVKVRSQENCDHHRDQLGKYSGWLGAQKGLEGYLFTLVRNPDSAFDPKEYGACARRSWWELYKHLQKTMGHNDLSDVESTLIRNLCEYLESEGIVTTYETRNLLSYSDGLKAQKAVKAIFNQVSSRLEVDGFKSVFVDTTKETWPRLEIGHPNWESIFGKGKNQNIWLWFMVPGIWDATRHDFLFDIQLWPVDDRKDWQLTKPKLANWFQILRAAGFDWSVWGKGDRKRDNMTDTETPNRIAAYSRQRDTMILLNQDLPQGEDQLVDLLVIQAKRHAEIISSLKP